MAAMVVIGGGCGFRIKAHCSNQPNKSAVKAVTFTLTTSCTQAARQSVSVIKVSVVCMGIKEMLA